MHTSPRTTTSAKVVCDSLSPAGVRLTTIEVTFARFVLAEVNTHRAFCLAGESVLTFDLPSGKRGGRRGHEIRISDFVDRWVHGAHRFASNPKRPLDLTGIRDDELYAHTELAERIGYAKAALATACRSGQIVGAEKESGGRRWIMSGAAFKAWRASKPLHTNFDVSDRLAAMNIRQLNEETGLIQTSRVIGACYSGEKPVYQVAAGGYSIAGSAEHRIKTPDGWTTIGELRRGDEIVVERWGRREDDRLESRYAYVAGQWRAAWQHKQRKRLLEEHGGCQKCGANSELHVHHIIPVHVEPALAFDESNVVLLCATCHRNHHRSQGWQRGNVLYGASVKVERVGRCGVEPTFDLEIAGEYANFLANGVVVHNSRSSASSRAIPARKQIHRVLEDPFVPLVWASERPGMQGGDELAGWRRLAAVGAWRASSLGAAGMARAMVGLGVHKSVANRLIEPFAWHTAIVTATDWDGFFDQRCSPLAQPELRVAAEAMRATLEASTPMPILAGEWHLPYIEAEDRQEAGQMTAEPWVIDLVRSVSVARCARVSYLTHDGRRDLGADLALYERLVTAKPPHASPLEHVATPCRHLPITASTGDVTRIGHLGNLRGWDQLRHVALPDADDQPVQPDPGADDEVA